MSTNKFTHLHCHSDYSLLDGASQIKPLVARAKELGMDALAITDHGNLHGALTFYQECKKQGINPVVGFEAYITSGHRTERDAESQRDASYHLTLLAQNRIGFQNLIKLSTRAFLEGFYYKPRIDFELLEEHNEGLICLSGCIGSQVSQALLKDDPIAEEFVDWYARVFGDRYYMEIQNDGQEVQAKVVESIIAMANRKGLPLVATADAHYVRQEDADAQDTLLCIATGKYKYQKERMKMAGGDVYFLRSPEQMYELFKGHEDAVARSQEIADSVDLELDLTKRHFPVFCDTPMASLRALCYRGLAARVARADATYTERLERELGVIEELGFPDYFLIVHDFVGWAKARGIASTARGSGVGSLVCYCLYISHADPLQYGLLFERFLDLSRREAPDLDIDFDKDRRAEVLKYVRDKYGEDCVAHIGTFGTLGAKMSVRDVGRVYSIPKGKVAEITALIPDKPNTTLKSALEDVDELRELYETDRVAHDLIDHAKEVEGTVRSMGTHAAGVVISPEPLVNYVPLAKARGKGDLTTQWAMDDVEKAGLMKMDFLGLKNLTILAHAVDTVEKSTGVRLDPANFPTDDAATYDMMCRGETTGMFQVDGSRGMSELLARLKPSTIEHISAVIALYRPGPLDAGMVDVYVKRKQAEDNNNCTDFESIHGCLDVTYGVMVYQEQVMRVVNDIGGVPLSESYSCIKAISKKIKEKVVAYRDRFIKGAVKNGMKPHDATDIWEQIGTFARYGFNKSHSTAYALIAYQTAYMKCHFPVEFMAAVLSSDMHQRNLKQKDKVIEALEDCRNMDIEVSPPCVHRSYPTFMVEDGKILFGLAAIKGVSAKVSGQIAKLRPFADPIDMYTQCDIATKVAWSPLIKCGALDCFSTDRQLLLDTLDTDLKKAKKIREQQAQPTLFDMGT